MNFRIADTFTDSLGRLTAQEQKAAKITAFDLQSNPSGNGLSFHKLDRAKDCNFWSVRVNSDIRIIVHRADGGILLAYVDHHDDAYKWAERRRIERHPTTGAMQMVEVRERVEEVEIYRPSATPPAARPATHLFDNLRKFELMAFGVPEDWVDDVRKATEDTLFDIIQHLPQEAQEALLKLAVEKTRRPPSRSSPRSIPTPTLTPRAASGPSRMWTNCARRWTILGINGPSSSTRRSNLWSSGHLADLRA